VVKNELKKHGGDLFESLNLHQGGMRIPVEVSTAPIPDQNTGLVLAIVRDITERKHAEEEIRAYTHRMEVLLEIEHAITSTLDLEEVLEIIMSEMARVIPYDSISLQSRRNNSLEILACRGFSQPDEVVGLGFPLDPKYPNQAVVTRKTALSIEDVTQSYPHFQSQSGRYKSGHIRSWLGVPLVYKDEVTGMIALDRAEVLPFSEAEVKLAEAIASQAALAIENARLFSEAKRRLDRLASLRHIDRTITSSLDLRVTLNILLGHILQQLEVDAAAVLLYQPDLRSLEFVAGQGFRTRALQATNLRLGQGFAGQAALEGRVVQVSDLRQLRTGFLRSPDFRNEGFVSYLGIPLTAKGVITGVLEIYHRQPLDPGTEWMAFLETLAGQAAIAIDNIKLFNDLQMSNLELVQAYDATIEGWARALEMRDIEPEGHSSRVVDLTLELAQRLDVEEKQLMHIRRGALLHDLGMMGVSDAILQKPGELSDDEWRFVREHPLHAYRWLAPIEYLKPALDIPHYHHERWDGSGYPKGLKGEQIPLAARIFAVVDVWDSLQSERPYRKAWSREKTLTYLREQSGKHFDPNILDAFFKLQVERAYLSQSQ
jgi:HD-GYP domain-containing protein (c-di-GMP phosphodiesterase class II)